MMVPMTESMFDSIDISTIPNNATAVAGYVGGYWPTYSPLVQKFPKALHLSVAVNASEDADCLDVETGDATPAQAPTWVRHQLSRGVHRPVTYANASTMPVVISEFKRAGLKRDQYRLWIAHYTYSRPSPPFELGGDAVQYTDRALNRNLDESVLVDSFFTGYTPVVHKNIQHYDWFYKNPFSSPWGNLDEQKLVVKYDHASQHPHLNHLYLTKLEKQLKFLADRVATLAIHERINGKPSWGVYHRGWRFQHLIHRSQGHRFV